MVEQTPYPETLDYFEQVTNATNKKAEAYTNSSADCSAEERLVHEKEFRDEMTQALIHLAGEGEKKSVICCEMISKLIEHLPSLHEDNFTQPGQEELSKSHKHILEWQT